MKKSKYQFFEEIDNDLFLHYSAWSNQFILMKRFQHEQYETEDDLSNIEPNLLNECIKHKFIINRDVDEEQQVLDIREKWTESSDMYQVVVNPTLDCNLDCWYCYENRVNGSKISQEKIDAIKQHIKFQYSKTNFKCLKLSFFGGEPFLCFEAIRELIDYSKSFCDEHGLEFIADFTTNATLITEDIVGYLSKFRCHFQITLDGDEEQHCKIKNNKITPFNSYRKTIEVLRLINDNIPNHWLAVRVNFNNKTLRHFEDILKDISFLDRTCTYVIIKKVWQLETSKVDKEALLNAIQLTFDYKFRSDYYIMPKGCLCFAERRNQVLINYDGGIFKCTTICSFDKENSLGCMDSKSGEITWDKEKTEDWYREMQPSHCKECKWFPACMGICNRQLLAHKGEEICTFDAMNLSPKEYLLYLFKYCLLENELLQNTQSNT